MWVYSYLLIKKRYKSGYNQISNIFIDLIKVAFKLLKLTINYHGEL